MKIYHTVLKHTLVAEIESSFVNTPESVLELMQDSFNERPNQESFWVLMLNRKNKLIHKHMHTIGAISSSLVCPSELFKTVVLNSCSAMIVCHNHPSGDPSPSSADIQITRKIKDCADLLDIDFLDHVICGQKSEDPAEIGYYSFREAGLL